MVVDPAGRFLTQREYPRLAVLRPAIEGDTLMLSVPGGQCATVPLVLPPGTARMSVQVWEHSGPAGDAGDEVAELISEHLDTQARLVGLVPDHDRSTDPRYAPGGQVGFADGFPLLIIGEASLAALNDRLVKPLPMNRFRPNIVVADIPAFAEDRWQRITIGDVSVSVVKPCVRCTITTVDQATGVRTGAEPLRALGTFRRGERGVLFGQNAVTLSSGSISVGDPVREQNAAVSVPG